MLKLLITTTFFIYFCKCGDAPPNIAFCSTTTTNIRNAPCGTVIDSASPGQCFRTLEGRQVCSLSGASYNFWELENSGSPGWIASEYLDPADGYDKAAGRVPGESIEPPAEFRGAFIATVSNIDWPSSCNPSGITEHQAQMTAYLDALQDANMNAILLQVRTSGDAFYNSLIEPWSRYLTCTQGSSPSPPWDPLEWIIGEAHSKGIEVHAWLNPYRANLSPSFSGLASNHPCLSNLASSCHIYDKYLWMDPGAPEVVDHLINVISDILQRYEVDGIHFDDYFYPYPSSEEFPDDSTYAQYGDGMARDDWRRDNVNKMVARVSQTVKALKPDAKFSISPFGIYRPGHPEGMPSPIVGFDPYSGIYADAKAWLLDGLVDFIAPQLYWGINPASQSYNLLFDWWTSSVANPLGIPVMGATGLYKVPDQGWPAEEIYMQVDVDYVYFGEKR
ncbi:hypothetical protein QYM36_017138 [Artemia franciscana]|uniref:Glycosyl hydrolase-like 10 domain-containing protein n=1 Tax=Artemia franciscana TaxID=6661 RepID=A0AA88HG43_ARTSF|nr:hypothetical protein QYM36_017138 [Artemia franciscana]